MKKLILLLLLCFVTSFCSAQTAPYFDDILPGVGKFSDGTAAAPSITFGSDPDTGIYRYGANAIGAASAGVFRLKIDSDNVPVTIFRATNTVNTATGLYFAMQNSANAEVKYGMITSAINDNTAGAEAGRLVFSTLSGGYISEKMRVNAYGNVLIGTTTDDGVNKLQVNGEIKTNTTVTFFKSFTPGEIATMTLLLAANGVTSDRRGSLEVIVTSGTQGYGLFHLSGSLNTAYKLLDSRGNMSVTKGAATFNIYNIGGGNYEIQANDAGPNTILFIWKGI